MRQTTFDFVKEYEYAPKSRPTFLELYLAGHVTAKEIDDWVDFWHSEVSSGDLMSFLGLTWDEYATWVEEPDKIESILESHK